MRDLMVLGAMLLIVPLAMSSPLRAHLVWFWSALVGINFYVYGFMRGVQFNLIFALIALVVLYFGKDSEKGKLEANTTFWLFMLFVFHCTASAIFAYPGLIRNWEIYTQVVKTFAFCFCMPIVLTRRYRIHAFLVVLVLGLAIHGLVDGLKTIASGGGHHVIGIQKFGDNNHTAVLLVMLIPLVLYLYQYFERRTARLVCIATIVLLIAAVVGTNSRGGLLSLVAIGIWVVLTGRKKLLGMVTLSIGVAVILMLAPAKWWDRMDTIKTADDDASFMGRVKAWKISSAIAVSNPVFGGGFRAIENQNVWTRFRESEGLLGFVDTGIPDIYAHAAHSNYFEVLGDLGFVGLLLYLSILLYAFRLRQKIRAKANMARGSPSLWARDLSDALGASLLAYALGGAAVSMAYYEIFYILVMLMSVLNQYAFDPSTRG